MEPDLIVMPSSPALVDELAPNDQPSRDIVTALREVIARSSRPIALVGSRSDATYTGHTGSFRAWGAPEVTVGKGNHLAELVQRYVLGYAAARVISVRASLGAPQCDELTIVAADGSAGLTQKAPLAFLEDAPACDQWCRDLLGSTGTPSMSPTASSLKAAGIMEPDPWLELAELHAAEKHLLIADSSTGVGRYVAWWVLA